MDSTRTAVRGLATAMAIATVLSSVGCAGEKPDSRPVTGPLPTWFATTPTTPRGTPTTAAPSTPPRPPAPPVTGPPPYFARADWLWKPIAPDAVPAADSATWVGYLSAPGAQHVTDLYKYGVTLIPAFAITSTTPRYDVTFTKPWGGDPMESYSVPIPVGTPVPTGTDGQIAILDPATNRAFGLWQAKYDSAANTWSASWGGQTELDGDGIVHSGSATATKISRYAGVVGATEFSAAVAANTGLNHALVFSTDMSGPNYVAPAIKSDGDNTAGVAVPMPQGSRVQLDPSIDINAIPGITPGAKVIAKTLQTYGAYAVDKGDARMAFVFELVPGASATNPAAVWTAAGLSAYHDLSAIPWSKLRVIAP